MAKFTANQSVFLKNLILTLLDRLDLASAGLDVTVAPARASDGPNVGVGRVRASLPAGDTGLGRNHIPMHFFHNIYTGIRGN